MSMSIFTMTAERFHSTLFQKHETTLKIIRFDIKPLRHQEIIYLEWLYRRGEQTQSTVIFSKCPVIYLKKKNQQHYFICI